MLRTDAFSPVSRMQWVEPDALLSVFIGNSADLALFKLRDTIAALKCYVISLNILNYFLDLGIRPKNMIAFRAEHDIKCNVIYSGQRLTIIPLFVDISFHYNILVIREKYY